MILGRPWLKEARTHHNWGDNTLIITLEEWNVIVSTIKCVSIKSSQRPKILDIEFDWDEALSKQKEE
jgi:hypothetical protein